MLLAESVLSLGNVYWILDWGKDEERKKHGSFREIDILFRGKIQQLYENSTSGQHIVPNMLQLVLCWPGLAVQDYIWCRYRVIIGFRDWDIDGLSKQFTLWPWLAYKFIYVLCMIIIQKTKLNFLKKTMVFIIYIIKCFTNSKQIAKMTMKFPQTIWTYFHSIFFGKLFICCTVYVGLPNTFCLISVANFSWVSTFFIDYTNLFYLSLHFLFHF